MNAVESLPGGFELSLHRRNGAGPRETYKSVPPDFDRVKKCSSQPVAALRNSFLEFGFQRHHKLGGCRRSRSPKIRNKITNRKISFVPYRGYYGDLGFIDCSCQCLIVKAPEVLHRSAAVVPAVAHHRLRGSASLIPTPVARVPFVADVGVGRDRFRHGVADVARYRLPVQW